MFKMIEQGLDAMKQGIDSLKNIKKDKRDYKKYLARIKALPDDYRFVFEKMTGYMWGFSGGGNGCDMVSLQADLLELFEMSVTDGKRAIEVTGGDVAAFCDELLRNAKTYTEKRREKLNNDIMRKLGDRARE